MAWFDLTGRAGLPTAGDLNAYPGNRVRVVCWPQATGSNDLVAYRNDLRPFTDGPGAPVLVSMSASLADSSTFTGTLSGHIGGGGGGNRYVATMRRSRGIQGRRTRRRT